MLTIVAQQLVNGLVLGAIYALVALGYTLVFGVARLIFFAQGDLSMVAAVAALVVLRTASGSGWGLALALTTAIVAGATTAVGTAILSERLALRPLRRAPHTKQLVASLGVMLVLQNAVYLTVGSEHMPFPVLVSSLSGAEDAVVLSPLRVAILMSTALVTGAAWYVVGRTEFGLKMRAVADSPENAARDGIDHDTVVRRTFALGAVIATVAGLLLAQYDTVVRFDMGFLPGIKGFTAAVLGGLGSFPGAVVGGLVLGIVESLAAGFVSSDYRHVIAYAVLIAVLVFRPQGILGRRAVR